MNIQEFKFKKLTLLLIATFIGLVLCTTAYGATEWVRAQQKITAPIKIGAIITEKNFTLSTANGMIPMTHTEEYALSVTTRISPLTLTISQTVDQKNSLNDKFSVLKLHVRKHGETVDFIFINLLTETSKSQDLPTISEYLFDYYFEYTAKTLTADTNVDIILDLSVTGP